MCVWVGVDEGGGSGHALFCQFMNMSVKNIVIDYSPLVAQTLQPQEKNMV